MSTEKNTKDKLTNITLEKKVPIVFGPIPSRRFGISLGIDLSPSAKQCNFDCLYCELDSAKTVDTMSIYPTVIEVMNAINNSLLTHNKIDVITLTANGEPTLYPKLDELIDEINKIKKNTKTLILSNGSTIYDEKIFNTLLKIDTVKLSLDCASVDCFKKLDRVHSGIDITKIIKSMIEFSRQTTNDFVLEILIVETLNDKDTEIELLYEAVKRINPKRVDIGTIDRPPAYKVKGVSFEKLQNIANKFYDINVNIVYKNRPKQINSYTKDEILATLTRRPLSTDDIDNMFDTKSKQILDNLVDKQKILLVNSGGVDFYKNCQRS